MSFLLLITLPLPVEEADAVLDCVDGVADEGEDDEEADDYDGDDDVAFYHCGGGGDMKGGLVGGEEGIV